MRPVVIVLVALLAFAGCSSGKSVEVSDQFCEAARKLDTEIAATEQDPEAQIELVTPLVEEAPPELRADAQTWLDALERVAAGDESIRDDPEIEKAVDNVNRVAQNECDILGSQGGSPFG